MLRDLTYQVYRAEAEGMERAQRVLDKMTAEQVREVAGKIEERERAHANEA
jgi:NAD(P)H-nitrite reductase large subunit